MNYKELQKRVRLYREAGYTTINLNSSYNDLMWEYAKIIDESQIRYYKVKI